MLSVAQVMLEIRHRNDPERQRRRRPAFLEILGTLWRWRK